MTDAPTSRAVGPVAPFRSVTDRSADGREWHLRMPMVRRAPGIGLYGWS
jgi:hypothetical protein